MKRVYVAGAFSADNVLDVLKNIGKGEHYASKLFLLGYAPFCPWHDKDYVIRHWDKEYTVQQFYDYSLAWLEVSDFMVVIPGWEKSKGTLKEIEVANNLNIPIYYNLSEVPGWYEDN